MSVLRKQPFIEEFIGSLTTDDVTLLSECLNKKEIEVSLKLCLEGKETLITSSLLPESGAYIKTCSCKIDNEKTLKGIIILTSTHCVFIGYDDGLSTSDIIPVLHFDLSKHALKNVEDEKLTADELRRVVNDALTNGGSGNVTSVNGKTGTVVLNASDLLATNAQTIQQNLERIDGELERIEEETQKKSIIESESDTTIGGVSVPALTVEQIQSVYNKIVAGDTVVISSHDGTRHIVPLLADSLSGHIAIHFAYYTLMITYWIENEEVHTDYFDMSGGSSAE